MTVYIGVDLHARQQTLAFVDTRDGEIKCRELQHQKDDERAFVQELTKSDPTIALAQKLGGEFQRMIRARDENQLNSWFETVAQSGIVEFRNFAKGLRQDEAAVRAAMMYEWSNGMVEGHVNRLKLIKRQMYGRAKFDLLRARVLLAA